MDPRSTDVILCASSGRNRALGEPVLPIEAAGVVLLLSTPEVTGGPPGPVVSGVPDGVLRDRDRVGLDTDRGVLDLPELEEVRVVTSFLQRPDGRILLLRRSEKVGSFQGRWAAVSGYLEREDALEQALTEIREETAIGNGAVELARRGSTLYARDQRRVYAVEPFRFLVTDPTVTLDWEHTDARWVPPEALEQFETVPRLREAWLEVAGLPPGAPGREGRSEAI